jgi:hypothetical protein
MNSERPTRLMAKRSTWRQVVLVALLMCVTGAAAPTAAFANPGRTSVNFSSLIDESRSGGPRLNNGDVIVQWDPHMASAATVYFNLLRYQEVGHTGVFDEAEYRSYATSNRKCPVHRKRYSQDRNCIPCVRTATPARGVFYQALTDFNSKQAVAIERPKIVQGQRDNAVRIARKYSGPYAISPYSHRPGGLAFTKRSWYCSKIVWLAYFEAAGVDLDADGGGIIWPVDIVNSRLNGNATEMFRQVASR